PSGDGIRRIGHNRNGGGGLLRCQCAGRAMGHEHIDIELHQLGCKLVEAVVITLGPPIVDDNVLALLVSELAKAPSQGVNLASVLSGRENAKKADPVNFPGWLRCRRERPNQQRRRRSAADGRDELAALHSIASSARASAVGGISRPSALAVLRLSTVSYLVGACTGRSAGLSPLRMRST